jgi:pyruvate-ferredoxin/flavodoxin oxidoreductase
MAKANGQMHPAIPDHAEKIPKSESKLSDIHRFWEQTGNFYLRVRVMTTSPILLSD